MAINTLDLHRRIEQTITEAELKTSAEIRVHLEDSCKEDPLDRASYIFEKLHMHETKERNGVLIYVAFNDRKLAILGDAGIHHFVHQETWERIKTDMIKAFSEKKYEEGLCTAVRDVGNRLAEYYPFREGDRNELSNTITTTIS